MIINYKEEKTVLNYLDSNLEDKSSLKDGFRVGFEYEHTMSEHD